MPPVSPPEKPCRLTPAGGRTRAALRAAPRPFPPLTLMTYTYNGFPFLSEYMMSGFNLSPTSKEEQEKVAIDLVASGVAYKERLAMPVVPELVARDVSEHLRAYFWGGCTITASSVRSSRTKMPRNMPEKRMRFKNNAIPEALCLSLAGYFSCRVLVLSGQCVRFFSCQ